MHPLGVHDPLTLNLSRQLSFLLSKLPLDCSHTSKLQYASARSGSEILSILSQLLLVSSLTLPIATAFRPLLMDLCARWLQTRDLGDEKLVALSFLVQPHEVIFPYAWSHSFTHLLTRRYAGSCLIS